MTLQIKVGRYRILRLTFDRLLSKSAYKVDFLPLGQIRFLYIRFLLYQIFWYLKKSGYPVSSYAICNVSLPWVFTCGEAHKKVGSWGTWGRILMA